MKKGIIFDMDGTLWDSARQVADSWSIALQEADIENKKISASDMYSVMGKTMDEIANILFGELDEKKQKELLHACCEKENDYLRKNGGNLYPKVESTLEKLKSKYHLYIVSNCQSGYIEAFLHYYNFSKYFEDIECFGNNSKIKAENIKIVVDRNNLDKAVYVGDIQGDYDSSMAAGVNFIHAAYGFGTINTAVTKIDDFESLIDVVDKELN